MTKQNTPSANCEKLIDFFADKTPSEVLFVQTLYQYSVLQEWLADCPNEHLVNDAFWWETTPKPVMIGDVLDKICLNCDFDCESPTHQNTKDRIVFLWGKFGYKTSLNEIFAGEIETGEFQDRLNGKIIKEWTEQFKDQNTQAIYELLWDFYVSNQN